MAETSYIIISLKQSFISDNFTFFAVSEYQHVSNETRDRSRQKLIYYITKLWRDQNRDHIKETNLTRWKTSGWSSWAERWRSLRDGGWSQKKCRTGIGGLVSILMHHHIVHTIWNFNNCLKGQRCFWVCLHRNISFIPHQENWTFIRTTRPCP